jgi:GNAT superfamily N-acetyltransferase
VPTAEETYYSKNSLGVRRTHLVRCIENGCVEPYSLSQLADTRPPVHRCSMQIRPARIEDAVEACEILRRSITELCQADHRDDSQNLEAWLSNKTADNVRSWIANPNTYIVIATEGATTIGVGAVTSSGEIILNYVSPAARFRGVSKAILKWLEAKALKLGNARCAVTSTETARRFYLSAGYLQRGSPTISFGRITGYPMVKQLSSTA